MFATMILAAAAAQAAAAVPPAPPTAKPGQRTIIREIVIHRNGDDKAAAPKSKDKEERREIVIIRDGKDGAAASAKPDRRIRIVDVAPRSRSGTERRKLRILREPGAPGARIAMLSCDDGAKVDSEATDNDGKKTRVMICAKGGSSDGSKVQQLRDAAKRIENDSNLSPEARTRIVTAINEAIAKLPVNE